jgi:hypothetical protein
MSDNVKKKQDDGTKIEKILVDAMKYKQQAKNKYQM